MVCSSHVAEHPSQDATSSAVTHGHGLRVGFRETLGGTDSRPVSVSSYLVLSTKDDIGEPGRELRTVRPCCKADGFTDNMLPRTDRGGLAADIAPARRWGQSACPCQCCSSDLRSSDLTMQSVMHISLAGTPEPCFLSRRQSRLRSGPPARSPDPRHCSKHFQGPTDIFNHIHTAITTSRI